MQGVLQAIAILCGQLPVPQKQELRRRQGQQEQVPVLSAAEMSQAGNESGRSVQFFITEGAKHI
ncbi:unnamed protein product [Callosobruchus maculatus]|uniref:Uncharacterized protein n=1 Tax=Callosobruchus maculatus TaxID=64391 RepID=A0A653C6X4_CALMS|nr:unnamed protein product [Callosobruchus maculatus]